MPFDTTSALAGISRSGWNSAPCVPITQCGGHTPPYSSKCVVFGGCQSRVTTMGMLARSAAAAHTLSTGMTWSPLATASDPPGQKSFCGSTSNRLSPARKDGGFDITLPFLEMYAGGHEHRGHSQRYTRRELSTAAWAID